MSRLITYSDDASTELEADSEHAKSFYHQLFLLHEISIELSRAESLDNLYQLAVNACLTHLDIDRMGILMIDKERDWMVGTWGTDEEGNVRSETDYAAPMLDDVKDVIREMSTKGKVCVWHDIELYEFGEKVGEVDEVGRGWNAALAIWDNDEVIGWIACDNLLNHKPFHTYQSHTLRLFGSILGEFIKRQHAEEEIIKLNASLESKIERRTAELSKAQAELKQANTDLEQKVLERTALLNEKRTHLQETLDELQATQSQLVEAEKQGSIAQLVMGMAHELNTPLGNIKMAASLQPNMLQNIEEKLANGKLSAADLNEHLRMSCETNEIISSNAGKMADLVAQFKKLSIHETQFRQSEQIELAQWLKDTASLACDNYGPNHTPTISVEVLPSNAKVTINTAQLAQAIEDLVFNALEHGLTNHSTDEILIISIVHEHHLELNFEDNGKGVSAEIQDHIFDPFVTTARSKGGKGLGLNLVYNLVTQGLKGHIQCYQPLTGGFGIGLSIPLDGK
ncbi:ATP-binding protein [Vibrio sp. SCSIO 43136]|uniref:sensor histidine kinase n=1 Tax=Vibrio sp. SCSIO 43136 TaxID=2819101 RepID=UPI002075F35B|nr:ATP-binding protein [Vibrio sp. SCSIO 43136]USD67710.1 hypothetical protein J4N39_16110 [Vibrio sp. SCSIO 43136]